MPRAIRPADTPSARPRLHDDADDDGRGDGYTPPQSPEDDHWLWLGLKVALAMFLAHSVARGCGFEQPTWSVLTAAFLATSPPVDSGHAALKKAFALLVGVTLGAAGAWAANLLSSVPGLHFALVGIVAGALTSRSSEYMFAAVVGTVVTFAGSSGGDPLAEVVATTVAMVLIGCIVGPAVVWLLERARAWRAAIA